jgi:predicted acylesterase/phospholipase RssA
LFQINAQNIYDSYINKGLFDIKTFEKCFKPLFDAKDISMELNLLDFYRITNIELHLFSFEINSYKIEDISHITHPELPLIRAAYMSCCLPLLFTPTFIENKCFVDGGIACNYPLQRCIDSGKNPKEILGFKKTVKSKIDITEESTLMDFLFNFALRALFIVNTDNTQPLIENEITFDIHFLSYDVLESFINYTENRQKLFEEGTNIAKKFIERKKGLKALESDTNSEK